MEMLQAMGQGLSYIMNPAAFLIIFLMIIYGIIIGILPGIGILVAMVLVLPICLTLPMPLALIMLGSIGGACGFAGSIVAILINIPGENTSVATLLDGYPMTKKGEAGRAIGATGMALTMSYVVAIALMVALIPALRAIVKACGSAEQWGLVLVGVSFVAVLGGRGGPIRGLISGLLGFMLSFIGFQATTGLGRFTFGSVYLYSGLSFITVVLALFGTPEVINIGASGGIVEAKYQMPSFKALFLGMWVGALDVFHNFWLWFRSFLIGWVVGIAPGVGAATAIWIGYGQAKKSSKHPELFGTGIVEGVIGPEAARGSTGPGNLLTTIAFGIPGGAANVIMLGLWMMLGLTPGPAMLKEHLDICFLIILAPVVAHIFGYAVLFALARPLLALVYLKGVYLVPTVTFLVVIGAFVATNEPLELVVLAILSVLGYFMRKYDYSPAGLLLGFILGALFEKSFFVSLNVYGWGFLLRPIVIVLILLSIYASVGPQLRYGAGRLIQGTADRLRGGG